VLIDTSAWIEYLNNRPSPANALVRTALDNESDVITDPVIMEVLAGTPRADLRETRRLLYDSEYLGTWPRDDWEEAASIYRRCREQGLTPKSMIDCLIAAVAIRNDVAVLHHDAEFDRIAECTTLQVVSGL
jgi:predicted nucleic acid-binding protein